MHADRLAAFSPTVDAERKQTKDFLYENLYFSPALSDEKDDAEQIVGELFTFWMENPKPCRTTIRKKRKKTPSRGRSATTSPA